MNKVFSYLVAFLVMAFATANASAQKIVFAVNTNPEINVTTSLPDYSKVEYKDLEVDDDYQEFSSAKTFKVGTEIELKVSFTTRPNDKTFDGWYIGEKLLSVEPEFGYTVMSNAQIEARFKDIEYVDFVLPSGTFWATTNVGALTSSDPGSSFTWESKPANTPTREQWQELFDNCLEAEDLGTSYYITRKGTNNDPQVTIWLPSSDGVNKIKYWTSTQEEENDTNAYCIESQSSAAAIGTIAKDGSQLYVRTVINSKPQVEITTDEITLEEGTGYRIECEITDKGLGKEITEWGVKFYPSDFETLAAAEEADKGKMEEYKVVKTIAFTTETASLNGSTFTAVIENVLANRYNVFAYAKNDGGYEGFSEEKKFSVGQKDVSADYSYSFDGVYAGHSYVDLGDESIVWATCNIGAASPIEAGDYFRWGETEKYQKDASTYEKPTVDNSKLVDSADAANVIWGNGWRMSEKSEWSSGFSNDSKAWESTGNVGMKFTVGKTIFFLAAGYYNESGEFIKKGTYGDNGGTNGEVGYYYTVDDGGEDGVSHYTFHINYYGNERTCNPQYACPIRPVLNRSELDKAGLKVVPSA